MRTLAMMQVHTALRVFAILMLALGSQSCRATKIVLAHPDRGTEATLAMTDGTGSRSIMLQYDRARVTEQVVEHPPVCYECDGESGPGASFNLQFFARNDTPRQWEITSDMVHLVPVGPGSARVHRERHQGRVVIASIAPLATARIPIAFTVTGVDSDDKDSRLYGEYQLLVLESPSDSPVADVASGDSRVLLERRLSVDRYDQGKQAARVVLMFTVALGVIGLL